MIQFSTQCGIFNISQLYGDTFALYVCVCTRTNACMFVCMHACVQFEYGLL
jgi:hypothetical protein